MIAIKVKRAYMIVIIVFVGIMTLAGSYFYHQMKEQLQFSQNNIIKQAKIYSTILTDFGLLQMDHRGQLSQQWMKKETSESIKAHTKGYEVHLASYASVNPMNTPNIFEKKALDTFMKDKSRHDISEFTPDAFHYAIPLYVQSSCLSCHQGYKIGDIRGVARVSVLLDSYNNEKKVITKNYIISNIIFVIISLALLIFTLYLINQLFSRQRKIESINQRLELQNIKNYDETIISMAQMVELRDRYTAGHSQRVANYSVKIAESLGVSYEDCNKLYKAALLHDIGKIATPDTVLLKPGRLSEDEYQLIKLHSSTGWEIISKISMYKDLAPIIRSHHERYDGKGYPDGLKGDSIPFLSRIMAVADAFDAMTTNRIYRPRLNVPEALQELTKEKNRQFDTYVVDGALKALEGIVIETSVNQLPQTELEYKRFDYFFSDPLTRLFNEEYLRLMLNSAIAEHEKIAFIQLLNFTAFNKQHGWEEGNRLLISIAHGLTRLYPDNMIFRVQGDDFVILGVDLIEKNSPLIQELIQTNEILIKTEILEAKEFLSRL